MSVRLSQLHRLMLLVLLTLASGHALVAQEAAATLPPDVAPDPLRDSARLTQLISELERSIEQVRQEWQVPGISVGIVFNDKVLLSKGYGVRRMGASDTVDGDTLFAIASNSKAFTAVALAILVDEGKLKWDDHVYKHLPWFRLKDEAATRDIRIRDLLCHRSGLGTFSGDLLWWGTSYSPREVLERAAQLEPTAAFRAEYGYSNLMFLAAGQVIEAASGLSWSDFVSQRILQPLNMNRSICSVRDLLANENFATPHKTGDNTSQPIPWVNWDAMAAAGGIISSSNDMTQWLRVQLNGGAINPELRLFSEATGWEMWQAHTPMKISEAAAKRSPFTHFRSYGLGWSINDLHGHKLVGHGGGYDGMYSQVVMVPQEKLAVVVLTNSMTSIGNYLCNHIVAKTLQLPEQQTSQESLAQFKKSREAFQSRIAKAIVPVATGTQPSHALEAYTGDFLCPMYGPGSVQLENGKLVLRLHPNPDLVADLEHLHYDTFVIKWRKQFAWFEQGTAHFVADAQGIFTDIQLDVPNDDLWFYEIHLHRVNPPPK